jgi:hypothetical protein
LVLDLAVKTGVRLIWRKQERVAVLYDGNFISGVVGRMSVIEYLTAEMRWNLWSWFDRGGIKVQLY